MPCKPGISDSWGEPPGRVETGRSPIRAPTARLRRFRSVEATLLRSITGLETGGLERGDHAFAVGCAQLFVRA
jgi:hypothetical protein